MMAATQVFKAYILFSFARIALSCTCLRTAPVNVCGVRPQQMTQRIIGGHPADRHDWPWLVSLQYRFVHLCGAAVIADKWLLTASHCLYGIDHSGLSVFLNSTNIGGTGGYHVYIEHVYLHPDYDDDTFDYDIALLRLRDRLVFTTISPICVDRFPHENLNLDDCVIAGWGLTEEDGDTNSDILLEARVPIIPTCNTFLSSHLITDRMICAGYAEGGVDGCTGDSGGPLMCSSVDGIWQVVGVTSWSIGCGRPERPGVYANVSSMSTWIFNTME